MLTGEFRVTMDEKGRILIPSRLRVEMDGDGLYVTRGLENCLWMFLPQGFENLMRTIINGPGAVFNANRRLLQRNIISPAQLCEIDRSGRINIPPTLREFAKLELKEECTLLGSGTYLELWNTTAFDAYLTAMDPKFTQAAQEFGDTLGGV